MNMLNDIKVETTLTQKKRVRTHHVEKAKVSGRRNHLLSNLSPESIADYVGKLVSRFEKTGDERYLSIAETTLNSYKREQASISFMLQRAIVKKMRHAYVDSLLDVEKILDQDPEHGRALFLKVSLLQAMGEYAMAETTSYELLGKVPELVSVTTAACISSVRGKAHSSAMLIDSVLQRNGECDKLTLQWALRLGAKLDWRRGDYKEARSKFEKAFGLGENYYLALDYADFLISIKDAERATNILQGLHHSTEVKLLLAMAYKQSQCDADVLEQWKVELIEIFNSAPGNRGANLSHSKARFYLEIIGDYTYAYELSKANWKERCELRDAALLMNCALVTESNGAFLEASRLIESSGISGPELGCLIYTK